MLKPKNNKKFFNNGTGFTLIELLVVIAIIALLVSILLPSLNHAKDLAKTLVCKTLMKNFGTAHALYNNETDGSCLLLIDNTWSSEHWWSNTLFRGCLGLDDTNPMYYVPKTFICPMSKADSSTPSNGLYYWPWSYGMNYFAINSINISGISNPAKKLFIADGLNWILFNYHYNLYSEEDSTYPSGSGVTAYRHNDEADVVFYDGHVDALTEEELNQDLPIWDITQ